MTPENIRVAMSKPYDVTFCEKVKSSFNSITCAMVNYIRLEGKNETLMINKKAYLT